MKITHIGRVVFASALLVSLVGIPGLTINDVDARKNFSGAKGSGGGANRSGRVRGGNRSMDLSRRNSSTSRNVSRDTVKRSGGAKTWNEYSRSELGGAKSKWQDGKITETFGDNDSREKLGGRKDDRKERLDERKEKRQDKKEDIKDTRQERREQGKDVAKEWRDDQKEFYEHVEDHYHHHWYGHYHYHNDYYLWFGFGVIIGASVASIPTYTLVYVSGDPFYYAEGVYYIKQGSRYIVVPPPENVVVTELPKDCDRITGNDKNYKNCGGVFYVKNKDGYKAVKAPVGVVVKKLPEEADKLEIDGATFYLFLGTYYKPYQSGDDAVYMIVDNPE